MTWYCINPTCNFSYPDDPTSAPLVCCPECNSNAFTTDKEGFLVSMRTMTMIDGKTGQTIPFGVYPNIDWT